MRGRCGQLVQLGIAVGLAVLAVTQPAAAQPERLAEPPPGMPPKEGPTTPALARNPATGGFLLAWVGPVPGSAAGEYEVYTRALDREGRPASDPRRVTRFGRRRDARYGVVAPELAYDPEARSFLLVYTGYKVLSAREGRERYRSALFAQTLAAASPRARRAVRLSRSVTHGNWLTPGRGFNVGLAFQPRSRTYLVAWSAMEERSVVEGRLVDRAGRVRARIRRISARPGWVSGPSVAVNPRTRSFLVAWSRRQAPRHAVFGAHVGGAGETASRPFRISVGQPLTPPPRWLQREASEPVLAFSTRSRRFALAWILTLSGRRLIFETNVVAQLLSADGRRPTGPPRYLATPYEADDRYYSPHITYARRDGTFTVVWAYEYGLSSGPIPCSGPGEVEFARLRSHGRLAKLGRLTRDSGFPDSAPDPRYSGQCPSDPEDPAVAPRPGRRGFVAVWGRFPYVLGTAR